VGQKTHPLGFRLGITQNHKSSWYIEFDRYGHILEEDDLIRTYINKFAEVTGISNIQIERNSSKDHIYITIEAGRPGQLTGEEGIELKILTNNLKKFLKSNNNLTIKYNEVKKPGLDAALIANSVVRRLEERIAFRRAIREALQVAQKENVYGIKIQVSGRLNGAEIARSEWIREGRVPLQTLRANIDYSAKEANTIYGVLGIKVWLFKNEILTK